MALKTNRISSGWRSTCLTTTCICTAWAEIPSLTTLYTLGTIASPMVNWTAFASRFYRPCFSFPLYFSSSLIHLFIDKSVRTKMASNLLKVGTLIRCLYKLEFTSSNRSPRYTKDWVGSHLNIVYSALGNIIEGNTLVFEKQLLIIQMR